MTTRKTVDSLLGGQPLVTSSPPGSPSDTKFFGRGEPFEAGIINRGYYALGQQIDSLFESLNNISRKSVTTGAQLHFSAAYPTNTFDISSTDSVSAYSGISQEDVPSSLFDILQPSTPNTYQESVEGAFTVYSSSPLPGNEVVFQVRTLPEQTKETRIKFDAYSSSSITITTTSGTTDDILVQFNSSEHTYSDIASAINGHSPANSWVEAVGKDVSVIDDLNTARNSYIPLKGKSSVDAAVVGVFVGDPFTGDDVIGTNIIKDIAVSKKTGPNELTLSTNFGGDTPIVPGDYIVLTVNGPTQLINSSFKPTGRHQVLKVSSSSTPATSVGHVVKFEKNITILSDLGYSSDDHATILITRYSGRLWAIGHSHCFDDPKTGNPIQFKFSDTDLNVHWFYSSGGIPFNDFSSGVNTVRMENIYTMYSNPSITTDAPSSFNLNDLSATAETISGGRLFDNGSASKMHMLIRPRVAGSGGPKTSLEDFRVITNQALGPSSLNIKIRSLNVPSESSTAWGPELSAKLVQVGTVGTNVTYKIDPVTVTEGTLPESNSFYYHKIVFNVANGEPAKLVGAYFNGTNSGSPMVRIRNKKLVFTDVEVWIVHESGDSSIPNLFVDVWSSSTGLSGSFVKVKSGVPLKLSHIVRSGPPKNTYAYRAQVFPEGFSVDTSDGSSQYFIFNVIQLNQFSSDQQRRVVNCVLSDSQKNAIGSPHVGSYIGNCLTSGGLKDTPVPKIEKYSIGGPGNGFVASGKTFTDTSVSDFAFLPTPVISGDYLFVHTGLNRGLHRISSVSGSTLTLETPVSYLSDEISSVWYEIISPVDEETPAGIEGGYRGLRFVTNVDIEGIGGDFDFGYGRFTRFSDLPPDGLRATSGSFGDTGFLTAKVASIMGTPISEVVPLNRNLVSLDVRISSLTTVSVGLGTLSPLSYGQRNVSDFPSVNDAIAAAVSDLGPSGGVIIFKPGQYGGSTGSNVFTNNVTLPKNVSIKAESPLTVSFITNGYSFYLDGDYSGIEGCVLKGGIHSLPEDLDTIRNAVWVASSASAATAGQFVKNCKFEGNSRVVIGRHDISSSNGWRSKHAVSDITIKDCDFIASVPSTILQQKSLAAVLDYSQSSFVNTTDRNIRNLTIENCNFFDIGVTNYDRGILLGNADTVTISNCRTAVDIRWSKSVYLKNVYSTRSNLLSAENVRSTDCSFIDGNASSNVVAINSISSSLPSKNLIFSRCNFEQKYTNPNPLINVVGWLEQLVFSDSNFFVNGSSPTETRSIYLNATGSSTIKGVVINNANVYGNVLLHAATGSSSDFIRQVCVNVASFSTFYHTGSSGFSAIHLYASQPGNISDVVISDVSTSPVINESDVYTTRTIIYTYQCNRVLVSGVKTLNGNARILHNSSSNVYTQNSILATTGIAADPNETTQYRVNDDNCTRAFRIGVIDQTTVGFKLPPRSSFRVIHENSLSDGSEIHRYKGSGSHTFRIWRSGQTTYFTQNVKAINLSNGILSSVDRENATLDATVLAISSGFIGLYHSDLDNLKSIWSSSKHTPNQHHLATDIVSLIFNVSRAFIPSGGSYTDSDVRMEVAGNGVAICSNLRYNSGDSYSGRDIFNGTKWSKSVSGSPGVALIFNSKPTSASSSLDLVYLPSSTDTPATNILTHSVFSISDSSVKISSPSSMTISSQNTMTISSPTEINLAVSDGQVKITSSSINTNQDLNITKSAPKITLSSTSGSPELALVREGVTVGRFLASSKDTIKLIMSNSNANIEQNFVLDVQNSQTMQLVLFGRNNSGTEVLSSRISFINVVSGTSTHLADIRAYTYLLDLRFYDYNDTGGNRFNAIRILKTTGDNKNALLYRRYTSTTASINHIIYHKGNLIFGYEDVSVSVNQSSFKDATVGTYTKLALVSPVFIGVNNNLEVTPFYSSGQLKIRVFNRSTSQVSTTVRVFYVLNET